ncbi:MAG: hypothetical protein ACYC1D_12310 [Acidimicrobiales bacterium]
MNTANAPELLACHLEQVAARVLAALSPDRRLDVVNEVITQLIRATARATGDDLVERGPKLLLAYQ